MEGYGLYWGDLHSHCAVSYGFGTPERAIACAKEQLDFCSITGHAFWPDMPDDRTRYSRIIDYHEEGFARCRENWASLAGLLKAHDEPDSFVPFSSYEWHSLEFGDYNVYHRGLDGPLVGGADPDQMESSLRDAGNPFMMLPHHVGYRTGYRGIDWSRFDEARSPLVEVFSAHGCAESDLAPYPYAHTMGPRDSGGTAEHGLGRGLKFGLIGSTDHHGGFPGSYGDGRAGVWAPELSRDGLWEGLKSRRTCAVTGDKIQPLLRVNGAWPGAVLEGGNARRNIEVTVRGQDFIDYVEVLKNERILRRFGGEDPAAVKVADQRDVEAKVRVEWGWGEEPPSVFEGELALLGGELLGCEPCFRGESVLSPDDAFCGEADTVPHRIVGSDLRRCAWRSVTGGEPSRGPDKTQSLIAAVRMRPTDRLRFRFDTLRTGASLAELLEGSRSYHPRGWLGRAVRVHRAVPASHYAMQLEFEDSAEHETDFYRLRVAQRNGQWAWTSPIWVAR